MYASICSQDFCSFLWIFVLFPVLISQCLNTKIFKVFLLSDEKVLSCFIFMQNTYPFMAFLISIFSLESAVQQRLCYGVCWQYIEYVDQLDIFIMSLPVHVLDISFHVYRSSLISLTKVLSSAPQNYCICSLRFMSHCLVFSTLW